MKNRGFTFVEVVIVMGIMALLMGIGTVGMLRSTRRAGLNEVTQILLSDLKSQQTKAMTGVTVAGVVPAGFGVHFETNGYTLFSGTSYNPTEPTNVSVPVPIPHSMETVGFDTILFLARSGEISGYSSGSVTIQEESGQTKTIQLNRYGVIL